MSRDRARASADDADAASTSARADSTGGDATAARSSASLGSRARLARRTNAVEDGYPWPRASRGKRPGDALFWHRVAREYFDVQFTHWAVYVGAVGAWDETLGVWRWVRETDDVDTLVECVAHLWGAPDGDAVNVDMDANAACVLTPLADVGEDPRCGNAKYDASLAPLRIGEIMDRCRLAVDQGFYEGRYGGYSVRSNNCEHFVTWARYGHRVSEQIEQNVRYVTTAFRVAASLMASRDVGEDPNTMYLANHFLTGSRSRANDKEETERAIRDLNGGRAAKHSDAEDVAYVLDYLIDCVDVEYDLQRARERHRVFVPWSSRPVPGQQEVARITFGPSRGGTRARDEVVVNAAQVSAFAAQVGGVVRQAAASALTVLGALGEEFTRSSRAPRAPSAEDADA